MLFCNYSAKKKEKEVKKELTGFLVKKLFFNLRRRFSIV
jgi:hypothetical protein